MTIFRYLALLAWIAVPLAAWGVYASKGLPHVIVEYTFLDNGHPYDLAVERHYLTCTFWGPYGTFHVDAEQGKCAWVRFFRQRRAGK
ncbi:hypothetical protein FJU08_00715 [Martelella alba]|uniref:Uncharacterized protein n=1 Tax=Martelella alba TaxID=2590451 RepID=A0A506UIN0_9HYPH|nr:hypothetical protein [Martelella alba]TPW33123.1 hypothetical protein FJU08_00715 [Martelella alba]